MRTDVFVLAGVHLYLHRASFPQSAVVWADSTDPPETHWMAQIRQSTLNEPDSDSKLAALVGLASAQAQT